MPKRRVLDMKKKTRERRRETTPKQEHTKVSIARKRGGGSVYRFSAAENRESGLSFWKSAPCSSNYSMLYILARICCVS